MKENLDNKLKALDLGLGIDGKEVELTDRDVAQIKQVFAEEGYVDPSDTKQFDTFFTGKQWYERWKKEADKVEPNYTDVFADLGYHQTRVIQQLYKAARKASGL